MEIEMRREGLCKACNSNSSYNVLVSELVRKRKKNFCKNALSGAAEEDRAAEKKTATPSKGSAAGEVT
jgi:hypothetical protein